MSSRVLATGGNLPPGFFTDAGCGLDGCFLPDALARLASALTRSRESEITLTFIPPVTEGEQTPGG